MNRNITTEDYFYNYLYLDRPQESYYIRNWFHTDKSKILLIYGVGGIGKTTLIKYFIKTDLNENEYVFIEPSTFNFNLDEINIKINLKKLLIIDNAELISNNKFINYIETITSENPNLKIIITSRLIFNLSDSMQLNLHNFNQMETKEIFSKLNNSYKNESKINELVNLFEGNPLLINLSSQYIKSNNVDELLYNLKNKSSLQQLCKFNNIFENNKIIESIRPKIITLNNDIISSVKHNPDLIYSLSPRKFEELIADLFHNMGWDVELTKQTRDGGKDIIAFINTGDARLMSIIEVKRNARNRPVGVSIVRELYGTMFDAQANSAFVVTSSYFTRDAKNFQQKHKYLINLKDYEDVIRWINMTKG